MAYKDPIGLDKAEAGQQIRHLRKSLHQNHRSYYFLSILIHLFWKDSGARIHIFIRLQRYFHLISRPALSRWMRRRMRREFACMISPNARIGARPILPHPLGIVIGEGVRIGDDCIIYQQVTMGGARRGDMAAGNYPRIGDRVTIFAGARLLGNISVGDDAVIGANAVVLHDVPAGHVAVGVPAKHYPKRMPAQEPSDDLPDLIMDTAEIHTG